MCILIIRHAELDYAIDSLTGKGFREAELLAKRMLQIDPDAVYCSPQGQARDTARPALNAPGREEVILPWLHELPARVPSGKEGETMIPWNLSPQYWTKEAELFDRDAWHGQALMAAGDVEARHREVVTGLDDLLLSYGYRRDGICTAVKTTSR